MNNIYTVSGRDLTRFLREIEARVGEIDAIHLHPREDGIAIKVNEGMWTPTLGTVREVG